MKKINYIELFLMVLVFLLFFIRGVLFLDPDFGWHLKAGEMYLTSGIPKTDPFSYTMPSYPWVDHAWTVSIMIAFLYKFTGVWGLSFIFSIVAFLSLLLAYPKDQNGLKDAFKLSIKGKIIDLGIFNNVLFILSFGLIFAFFGIRSQVFSWLFFSLFLKILFNKNTEKRVFIPLIAFLWANFHGSYMLGPVIYSIVIFFEAIRQKRLPVRDVLILIISIAVTVINPYKIGLWRESFLTVFGSKIQAQIVEWMPSLTMLNLLMIVFIPVASVFIWKQKEKFRAEEIVVFGFLLFQSLLSRRHLPLLVIYSLPLATSAIYEFYKMVQKIKFGAVRYRFTYKLFFIIVFIIAVIQLRLDFKQAIFLNEGKFYPKGAVNFLKSNATPGNLFSEYGYGGYLLWKLPGNKTFIDGRMPVWRWNADLEGEENNVMQVYVQILKDEVNYKSYFEKYNISTVLWPNFGGIKNDSNRKESRIDKYANVLRKFLKIDHEKESFIEKISKDGWNKIYEDGVSVIYKAPN